MRKIFSVLLPAAILLLSFGCASTPSASDTSHNEKKRAEKKLRFDDWKYMGFGQEIPDWVEPASNGDIEQVKRLLPELAGAEIIILSDFGMNVDQAEESLSLQEIPAGYSLFDSFWVRIAKSTENPYVALAIYKMN